MHLEPTKKSKARGLKFDGWYSGKIYEKAESYNKKKKKITCLKNELQNYRK